jgi:hypothetical protein
VTEPTTDPVLAEIEELRQQIAEAQDRIAHLWRLRSHPTVVPVLHYWVYRAECRTPAEIYDGDESTPLEAAYQALDEMEMEGQCSAEGVSVGGYEYSMAKLGALFDPED